MIFVTIAVAIFILFGLRYGDYWKKHTSLPQFYSQSEIGIFQRKFAIMIAAGVTIILIDVIILISLEALFPIVDEIEYLECFSVALFMLLITLAVPILVYAGAQASKYNIAHWNEMHDENSEAYKKNKLKRTVCGCLMLIATILYLIIGFVYRWPGIAAALIYSVFGIFCGIASVIIEHKTIKK